MSTTSVQNGSRTSYEDGFFLFSYTKQPRSTLEYAQLRNCPDMSDLKQFSLFETGYAYFIVIDTPKFIQELATTNKGIDYLLKVYAGTLENEFKDLSGLGSFNADTMEVTDNITSIQLINKVNFERSGTFSMNYFEKSGTPLSKFNELFLTGIKDPSSQIKTYYGLLDNDYSKEAGFEQECFKFLYIVTDNTAREVEKAFYFTGCQPQSVPLSELYEYSKGDISNKEITLEFSYHTIQGKEINKYARDILDWLNNDANPNKLTKNYYERQYAALDELKSYKNSMK